MQTSLRPTERPHPPPPVWGAQRHALSAGCVKGAQVRGQTDRPGYDAGSASSQLTSLGLRALSVKRVLFYLHWSGFILLRF